MQDLADRFGQFDPELLHSRFIRKDRKKKEDKIFAETDYVNHKENKNKPCLWISTQIVEASLDIDFDILLTENATIDALFQRFGRCWRKREYGSTEPNIFIFKQGDISYKIYDRQLIDKTWDVLRKYSGSLILEETKQAIIEEVFSDIENTKYFKDYKKYKDLLVLGMRAGSKSEAGNLFREINNNYTVIPEEVYNDNKNEIARLFLDIENRSIDVKRRYELKNELFGYTVPIQLLGNRRKLLHDIYIDGRRIQKLDIYLLKGVTYSYEKGAEFLKDYNDSSNFI